MPDQSWIKSWNPRTRNALPPGSPSPKGPLWHPGWLPAVREQPNQRHLPAGTGRRAGGGAGEQWRRQRPDLRPRGPDHHVRRGRPADHPLGARRVHHRHRRPAGRASDCTGPTTWCAGRMAASTSPTPACGCRRKIGRSSSTASTASRRTARCPP